MFDARIDLSMEPVDASLQMLILVAPAAAVFCGIWAGLIDYKALAELGLAPVYAMLGQLVPEYAGACLSSFAVVFAGGVVGTRFGCFVLIQSVNTLILVSPLFYLLVQCNRFYGKALFQPMADIPCWLLAVLLLVLGWMAARHLTLLQGVLAVRGNRRNLRTSPGKAT